jgi:hypothetical protein
LKSSSSSSLPLVVRALRNRNRAIHLSIQVTADTQRRAVTSKIGLYLRAASTYHGL